MSNNNYTFEQSTNNGQRLLKIYNNGVSIALYSYLPTHMDQSDINSDTSWVCLEDNLLTICGSDMFKEIDLTDDEADRLVDLICCDGDHQGDEDELYFFSLKNDSQLLVFDGEYESFADFYHNNGLDGDYNDYDSDDSDDSDYYGNDLVIEFDISDEFEHSGIAPAA